MNIYISLPPIRTHFDARIDASEQRLRSHDQEKTCEIHGSPKSANPHFTPVLWGPLAVRQSPSSPRPDRLHGSTHLRSDERASPLHRSAPLSPSAPSRPCLLPPLLPSCSPSGGPADTLQRAGSPPRSPRPRLRAGQSSTASTCDAGVFVQGEVQRTQARPPRPMHNRPVGLARRRPPRGSRPEGWGSVEAERSGRQGRP